MKTILDIKSLPPCAELKQSGECEAVCGNFERFLQDALANFIPKNVETVLIEAEANEFTKKCYLKFVESGLCVYLLRLEQEKTGTSKEASEGSYKFGQCVGLEGHVRISKN